MTSRLYPTTRRLFRQVFGSLKTLGLMTVLSPLSFALLALYVCGLLLLDRRQNGTRLAVWLPGRAHDALNRLLTTHTLSTRTLFNVVIAWAKHFGLGYLVVDEVVIPKPYSRPLGWVGYIWSTSEKRSVRGLCAVVVLFCVRAWRIPIAFRLWRPKANCAPGRYRKRTELAWEMLVEIAQSGLAVEYVAFDNFYTAGWLTKGLTRLGWAWVGIVESKTHICFQHRTWSASELAVWLKLKWRKALDVRARSIVAYLPKYGTLRLVVTKNRHGNYEILVTNALDSDLTQIVWRKRRRWSVETLFRDAKQFCGLAACQCRVDVAMVRHIAFVLLAFLVLQMLRRCPKETLGAVKERLQMEVLVKHGPAPRMLKGKVGSIQLITA
jgi:hypothetical protein